MSTQVIWQNNPHINGVIDNTAGTWTYGNYGGKGWTGGEFTPPDAEPKFHLAPKNDLDAVFKVHDQDYQKTKDTWNASAKTDADVAKYWQDTIAADNKMRQSIQGLGLLNQTWDQAAQSGKVPDFEMINAALQADRAFALKGIYDRSQLSGVVNPDTGASAYVSPLAEDPWFGSNPNDIVTGPVVEVKANAITTPSDAPTRNSAAFVADAGANQVEIKQGGTVWDTFVQQKNSATGFQDWGEYKAAVAASNPGIKDLNKVGVGTVLMQPEKLANGSITYHYSNQVSVNTHAANGTYHMVVPNTEGGGQTVFTRTYDSQTAQYTVTQVQTNGTGQVVFNYQGQQSSLDAPLTPVSASVVSNQQTTTRNGVANLPANETSWRQVA